MPKKLEAKLKSPKKLSTYEVELEQTVKGYRTVEQLAEGLNEAAAKAVKEAEAHDPAFRKDWKGRTVKAVSVKKVR